ncbi:translation initiation factor eIF-2B epsilon subunit, GEF, partial [Cryomyces antarcticus]
MVGKRCIVQPGALISYGVRVADGMTVKGSSRITRMKQKRDYDSEELVRGLSDAKVVGEGGDGFEFEDSDEENEDEIEGLAAGTLYNMEDMSLSSDSISTLNSEGPSEGQIIHHDRSAAGSFISVASDDSHASQHVSEFHHEAALGIFESLQKGDKATDISTELTALRMGQNASEHQVRRAVIAAVMKHTATLVESGTTAQRAAKDVITKLA